MATGSYLSIITLHVNGLNAPTKRQTLGAAAAAKSLQSCPALCDPTDGSPPGSAVPGILQTRILEWVAICVEYLFSAFHLQSVCVPYFEVGLLKTTYIGTSFFYPFSQSLSFGWGIEPIYI